MPQPQHVMLDTGSGMLIVPCKECNNCGKHIDPPYDPDKSLLNKKIMQVNRTIIKGFFCLRMLKLLLLAAFRKKLPILHPVC